MKKKLMFESAYNSNCKIKIECDLIYNIFKIFNLVDSYNHEYIRNYSFSKNETVLCFISKERLINY